MTEYRDEDAPQMRPYDWMDRPGGNKLEKLQAAGRTASERETAEQLALLLKAYPNAGSADREIFGALLIEDVASMQPAIGDIHEACRWLRRTSRFLPTIAEVIEALSLAQEQRLTWIRSIPKPASTAPIEPPKPQLERHHQVANDLVPDAELAALPL
jgi:hypothetical protein